MAGAGTFRHRAEFFRPVATDGGLGAEWSGWAAAPYLKVWARFKPERGREEVKAGVVRERRMAELMIRASAAAAAVAATDSVVVDGRRWNVRSAQLEADDRSVIHLVLEAAS